MYKSPERSPKRSESRVSRVILSDTKSYAQTSLS